MSQTADMAVAEKQLALVVEMTHVGRRRVVALDDEAARCRIAHHLLKRDGAGVGAVGDLHRDREAGEIECSRDDIDRLLDRQERAPARVGEAGVAVAAVGADVVRAIGGEQLALGRQRQSDDAGRAIDDDRFLPGRAVGAHLEMEIVVACGAHLGAARGGGLEQKTCGIAGCGLVDLVLVAGAGVVEEAGFRCDGELRCGVRSGVDAEQGGLGVARAFAGEREVDVGVATFRSDLRCVAGGGVGDADLVHRARRLVEDDLLVAGVVCDAGAVVEADAIAVGVEVAPELRRGIVDDVREPAAPAGEHVPCGGAPDVQGGLIGNPHEPAFARLVEGPGAVLVGGNLARLARPGARRACGDDVAGAVAGRARRRGEVLVGPASWTIASSARRASLWVTCFWAWAAMMKGRLRFGEASMGVLLCAFLRCQRN